MLKVKSPFKPKADTAQISEIFSSIQGEGLCVGEKHLFVRFRSCHIACTYCDEYDKVDFKDLSVPELTQGINTLDKERGPHEYVSLTGGEPLLYVSYLKNLMPQLKREGYSLYLETSGILHQQLEEVISLCDFISMDIKLPSVTGEKDFFKEHEAFLKIAKQKQVFVKIVLSTKTRLEEFLKAVDIISRIDKTIPLVLQPVTDLKTQELEPGIGDYLANLVSVAKRHLVTVKAIPQTHKWMNIR